MEICEKNALIKGILNAEEITTSDAETAERLNTYYVTFFVQDSTGELSTPDEVTIIYSLTSVHCKI